MFCLSKNSNTIDNVQHLGDKLHVHNVNSIISRYFEMDFPFLITLVSNRQENPNGNYIFSFFGPDFFTYYSYDKAEIHESKKDGILHLHNYYELMYVIDGTVHQKYDSGYKVYGSNSCCLLNSNILHNESRSTSSYTAIYLGLSHSLFKEISNTDSLLFGMEKKNFSMMESIFSCPQSSVNETNSNYIDFLPLNFNETHKKNMESLLDKMLYTLLFPASGATFRLKSYLREFWDYLIDPNIYHPILTNCNTKSNSILFTKISLLMEQSAGRITRGDLEEKLNYNGAYLNQIVKTRTGMSIFEYGMIFCLKEAERLLSTTDKSITEISQELQFNNRTHFYKLFKDKYAYTPGEYRKKIKQKMEASQN